MAKTLMHRPQKRIPRRGYNRFEQQWVEKRQCATILEALRNAASSSQNPFYPRLLSLLRSLGDSLESHDLIADVWAESLRGSQQSEIGSSLSDYQSLGFPFWLLLPSLGRAISQLPLTPPMAFTFLKSTAMKVARDYMQGGFWQAVIQLVKARPDIALSILEDIRLEDSTDFDLAQFLIGTLRHLPMNEGCKTRFANISRSFSLHRSVSIALHFLSRGQQLQFRRHLETRTYRLWKPFADLSATEQQRTIYSVSRLLTSSFLTDSVRDAGYEWLLEKVKCVRDAETSIQF